MIIDINVDHSIADKSLLVMFSVIASGNVLVSKIIDLKNKNTTVSLVFDLLEFKNQNIILCVKCLDLNIIKFPLTLNLITLDQFYISPNITYSGVPKFSNDFLKYADSINLFLDKTVSDVNCLTFTGDLEFTLKWPFFKNGIW